MKANDIEAFINEKKNKKNMVPMLHATLCEASGGWVPYEEFLNMPVGTVISLFEAFIEINKIKNKNMKGVKKGGR